MAAGLTLYAAAPAAIQAPQRPTFHAGVGLVAVDVQVVARDGRPIEGLTARDFKVWIDGRERPISSVAFVRAVDTRTEGAKPGLSGVATGAPGLPAGSTLEPRTIVLAIDQPSFRVINESAALEAATRLIKQLSPDDLLGLVAYPAPGISIAPTTDRAAIRKGLQQFGGRMQTFKDPEFGISLEEAYGIDASDRHSLAEVQRRECGTPPNINCMTQVQQVAKEIVTRADMQSAMSLGGLLSVVEAMKVLPGRTILVNVSAGVPMPRRPGGKSDTSSLADAVGRAATTSSIAMYTLYMDVTFLNAFSAATGNRRPFGAMDDTMAMGYGLERVSAAAGGTLFRIEVGPHTALERIDRETSAYYVLGVEPDGRDRDGQPHALRVTTSARNSTIRARRSAVIPAK